MPAPNTAKPPSQRRRPTPAKGGEGHDTAALRIAEGVGLLTGPKTRHFNAKVPPALFEAAARQIGATSPAAVITAALASLATEDELGPWLARNWGILADTPPELMEQLDL